ncbi:hypothetical protein FRC10_004422 [Ceratobasidium sp. 414]|nr:hypothetical protein FRC10_004422 [Ceratobasidium sp. 414]
MVVENIYRDSEEARWNVEVWSRARTLAEARPLLKKGAGHDGPWCEPGLELTTQQEQDLGFVRSWSKDAVMTRVAFNMHYANGEDVKGSRFTDKYLNMGYSTRTYRTPPTPPPRTPPSSPPKAASHSPTSPPRRVVSDFPTFSTGAQALSVMGTGVEKANPMFGGNAFGAARFGGMRDTTRDDDEDEDADGIDVREGNVTFDQAKRIALQSAWRGARG